MAKRGENIRKRKDGRWEGRYSKGKIDGKTVQGSVFGRTYQEAKEKLIIAKALQGGLGRMMEENPELLKEYMGNLPGFPGAAGIPGSGGAGTAQGAGAGRTAGDVALEANGAASGAAVAGTGVPAGETFGEVAGEWFASAQPTLKPSSVSRYRNILNNQLLPAFGTKPIVKISRSEVSAFSTTLLASGGPNGKGLSPKTVTGVLSVFKLILFYARHVKGLDVVDLTGIYVKQPRKQLRVFSLREQEVLNDYLLDDVTPVKLGILLCLYTGLRIGEVCALKWKDVSYDEQTLHVNKTMQRIQMPEGHKPRTKVIITTPKSNCSIRTIPIPEMIFHIVEDLRQEDDCYLLTGTKGDYMEPRTLENRFDAIVACCGIEGVTVHTCRHTFATRCIELGFDIKTLSEILGHASVSITMNRYVHPSMEMKQQSMNRLSQLLGVK